MIIAARRPLFILVPNHPQHIQPFRFQPCAAQIHASPPALWSSVCISGENGASEYLLLSSNSAALGSLFNLRHRRPLRKQRLQRIRRLLCPAFRSTPSRPYVARMVKKVIRVDLMGLMAVS